jgi:hypothetical protein
MTIIRKIGLMAPSHGKYVLFDMNTRAKELRKFVFWAAHVFTGQFIEFAWIVSLSPTTRFNYYRK